MLLGMISTTLYFRLIGICRGTLMPRIQPQSVAVRGKWGLAVKPLRFV